jgi:hypothetical protein
MSKQQVLERWIREASDVDLVNELLRRGWTVWERTRNSKIQLHLRAPQDSVVQRGAK